MDARYELALADLLREIHDLSHALARLSAELEQTRRSRGRQIDQARLNDSAESLHKRLGSAYDACRSVLRASVGQLGRRRIRLNPSGGSPLNILWVDDDAMHLSSLGGLFQDAKWRITQARTVDEALTLIEQREFDGVLVDLIMPPGSLGDVDTAAGRLTGLALSRRIRGAHPSWPIVFLTVANSADALNWCRENAPAAVLSKSDLSSDSVRKMEALIRYQTDASLDTFESLLESFPRFARAILRRHNDRPGFQIADEYDVQDLLRALLVLEVEDVRDEEWSPSYAGGSSRIDFVLPREQVAIEVKMTRPGLKLKQLGEQLLVDVARYKVHPDVKALLCFVVDATNVVANPAGFVNDLRQASSATLEVRAVVCQLTPSEHRARPNTYEASGCQGQKTPLTKRRSPYQRPRSRK